MKNIDILRDKINHIDYQVIQLLAKRQLVVKQIFLVKTKIDLPIVNTVREKKLQNLHVKWARQACIDDDMIKKIFRIILVQSRALQRSLRFKRS
jgi:chorismate mutase